MRFEPFGRLIPVPVAQRRLLAAVRPVSATEVVAVLDGVGRVAAESLAAPWPVPRLPRATWDGYAFRSADSKSATRRRPVPLRVVGELFAEEVWPRPLRRGTAVEVATGAAIPRGADTVVIFEEAARRGSDVLVSRSYRPGERVAAVGDDLPRGTRVLGRGDVLTPAHLGALAMFGRDTVRVYRRPRVALVPNGNELRPPGQRARTGEIYESNNATLAAVIRASGGVPLALPPVPDDPRRIEAALMAARRRSDVVLATGGSSVGERDFLGRIFPRLGRLLFHGIAVRPGKPTLAAVSEGKLLIGMPGHPTSCLANMYWLVAPVLRRLARLPGPGWATATVQLTEPYEIRPSSLTTVVPLAVKDGRARPTFQDSSAITSLAGANAVLLVPPRGRSLRRGGRVVARLLPPPVAAEPVGLVRSE